MTREGRAERVGNAVFVWLFGVVVLAYVALHARSVMDPRLVSEDATAQLPLFAYSGRDDPFRGDFLSDQTRATFVTPGVTVFYRLCPGGSPVAKSRVLWGIAFAATLASVWKVGRKLGGLPVASVCGILVVNSPVITRSLTTGLGRTAAFPFAAALLCALVHERAGLALGLLPIQAVFYPTGFAVCAPALGLWLLWRLVRRRDDRRRAAAGIALYVLVAGASTAWLGHANAERERVLGPVVTRAQASGSPEFSKRGRWPEELSFGNPAGKAYEALAVPFRGGFKSAWPPTVGWNRAHGLPLAAAFLAATAIALAVSTRARAAVPAAVWIFGLSSIGVFLVAQWVAYRLYLPRLILHYSLPLVSVIAVPAVLGAFGWRESRPLGRHAVLGALLVAYGVFQGPGVGRPQDLFWNLGDLPIPWEALRAAPRGSLVAADPFLADAIPLLTGQRVFVSHESALPLYPKTYREIDRRLHDYHAAVLTTDRAAFEDFVRRNRIDFLVIPDPGALDDIGRSRPAVEPLSAWVKRLERSSRPEERAIRWYAARLPATRERRSTLLDVRSLRQETASGTDSGALPGDGAKGGNP